MSLSILPFRNTDQAAVCEIWNSQLNGSRLTDCEGTRSDRGGRVGVGQMEAFLQSKVYFDPSKLLIARRGDQPVGLVHVCSIPTESLDGPSLNALGIVALCVVPDSEEDAIAASLLKSARSICSAAGIPICTFRPALPYCSFYVGLGPGDSLAGVVSGEQRLCKWLGTAGFKPSIPTTIWELNVANFRVPADRVQMLVRRRSSTERLVQEPQLPWWQACVLGHAEVLAFHLTDQVKGQILQELVLWSLEPELRLQNERIVWIWPPSMEYSPQDSPVEIAPADRLLFLLGESIRELQREQVDLVRTVTRAEANEMHRVLNRLGFKAVDSGIVFQSSDIR